MAGYRRDRRLAGGHARKGLRLWTNRQHLGGHCWSHHCRLALTARGICARGRYPRGNRQRCHRGSDSLTCDRSRQTGSLTLTVGNRLACPSFVGANADSERAIRWLIALMVLCCDPLAISLTAAASARNCELAVTHEREWIDCKPGSAAKVKP